MADNDFDFQEPEFEEPWRLPDANKAKFGQDIEDMGAGEGWIQQQTGSYYTGILKANRDKPFVRRLFDVEAPKLKESGFDVTHKMASAEVDGKFIAFPTVQQDNAQTLVDLSHVKDGGLSKALQEGNYIEFKTPDEADDFALNYKKGVVPYPRPKPETVGIMREFAKGAVTLKDVAKAYIEWRINELKRMAGPEMPKGMNTEETMEWLSSPDMQQWVEDLVMEFQFGGMVAGKKVIDKTFKRLGRKPGEEMTEAGFKIWRRIYKENPAIFNLEKSRRQAMKLMEQGKSQAFVQKATGWRKEPGSNQLIFEFSDKGMTISNKFAIGKGADATLNYNALLDTWQTGKPIKIRELIKHKKFEKYYDFLMDAMDEVGVKFDPTSSTSTAPRFSRGQGDAGEPMVIGLLSKSKGKGTKSFVEFREAILHEITHVVQGFEELFRGGSDKEFVEFWTRIGKAQGLKGKELTKWATKYAKSFYERFQGEIQARAVAARGFLSEKELRKVTPWGSDPYSHAVENAIRLEEGQRISLSKMFNDEKVQKNFIAQIEPRMAERGVTDIYLPKKANDAVKSVRGAIDKKKAMEWMQDAVNKVKASRRFRATGTGNRHVLQAFDETNKEWVDILETSQRGKANEIAANLNERVANRKNLDDARRAVDKALGEIEVPMWLNDLLD